MDANEASRKVFAAPDEILPVYVLPGTACGSTSATAAQHHTYYVVTLSGVGVIACVPFKSGCRNMPPRHEMPEAFYWFEQLADLGLASQERVDELKQHVWTVRSLLS